MVVAQTKVAALGMGRRSRMQGRRGRWRVQEVTPDERREVGPWFPGKDELMVGVQEVIDAIAGQQPPTWVCPVSVGVVSASEKENKDLGSLLASAVWQFLGTFVAAASVGWLGSEPACRTGVAGKEVTLVSSPELAIRCGYALGSLKSPVAPALSPSRTPGPSPIVYAGPIAESCRFRSLGVSRSRPVLHTTSPLIQSPRDRRLDFHTELRNLLTPQT